ncbi:hypothetical protein BZB76_0256 [Actinomadura pelletieri DSM 43383]|uniref:Uncharacterized protein n=1 Tax=Actinomadura pelletieri DSM 43383 TaxID=1120940 RepID=A0A495QXG6_9ACTN|nr:hypothetical protein [Actinomadura pelletieri]RKS78822.1 hypothetical protein BZB76_0256 [Actinomadura pelletieri DSM 43383]
MRVLLFFNELSCTVVLPKEQVDDAMKQFVGVLRRIAAQRGDTALVSEIRLADVELAPGYYLGEWSGRPGNRDLWRWIRGLQNRAPFSSVLPTGAEEGAEYFCDGRPAKGLGAAHLMDGASVSLPVTPAWEVPWVRARRATLSDDLDGDIHEDDVEIRHASALDHVDVHHDWISAAGISELRRGSEIWEARAELYPHLLFLPRTEQQFATLGSHWVVQGARELLRINESIGRWDPARSPEPAWRSYVTPESASRRHYCEFEDFDGVIRLFDLHGRFTPGPGRVYFRLVPEQRKATIANIGRKPGI